MDSSYKPQHENPRKGANFISQFLFFWIIPMLFRGSRKGLTEDDLTYCLKKDRSEELGDILKKAWEKETEIAKKKQRPPRLRNALLKTFGPSVIFDGLLLLLYIVFRTLLAVILAQLLIQFQQPISSSSNEGIQDDIGINQLQPINNSDGSFSYNYQGLIPRINDSIDIIYTATPSNNPRNTREIKNIFDTSEGNNIETTTLNTPCEFSADTLVLQFRAFFDYISTDVYYLSAALVLVALFSCFFVHHADLRQRMVGAQMRIACCSVIYRKTLRLSMKSAGKTPAGYLVNLISNDVGRLDYGFIYVHHIWIMPLQAVVIAYLLWRVVGYAALVGVIGLLIKTVPVQTGLSRLLSILRMRIAKRTDLRVGVMNEIIQGIQVIKMYAWEIPFNEVVAEARRKEIQPVRWASYIRGVNLCAAVFIERSTLFITLLACVLLGQTITADIVFSMAQFFNVLQLTAAIYYPIALGFAAEALVSMTRIEEYLLLEDKDETSKGLQIAAKRGGKENALNINQIIASWDNENTLENIIINIKPGQLYAIIGPVGAGKSSLLQLLLGELPIKSGTSVINGTISYSSQEAWLFTGTVRSNILFGQEYDKTRYEEVIKCCALIEDFHQFPNGDKTIVGERGASLSGGQRTRISLARAVYKVSSIYLLDDPLSAVDAHVGKQLFDEVIGPKGYLAKQNTTRLLVTHQVHFLKEADFVIILDQGKIVQQGTYNDLANSNLDFGKMLHKADENEQIEEITIEMHEMEHLPTGYSDPMSLRQRRRISSQRSIRSNTKSISSEINKPNEKEEKAEGGISPIVWKKYFLAGGTYFTLITLLIVLIFSQVVTSASDYFVNFWTQQEFLRTNNESTLLNTDECLYIYGALVIGVIAICTLRGFLFFNICMRASKRLHNLMFSSILGAPMRFFDTNPSGRILNRFSKDMGAIDEMLPKVMMESVQIMLVMIGILAMVSIVNPLMLAALTVAVILFGLILKLYIRPAQDFKRLEGICRSPVFSHLSATILGISTIRARGLQPQLAKEFDNLQDVHSGIWQLTMSANTTLGLWLDIVSTAFVACVTFSFVVLYSDTFSGNVGLAISQSLILTGMVQYGVRQTAEALQQMTSVERVLQYTDLDQEPNNNSKPPTTWPEKGQVTMKNMTLRYAPELPAVLKNVQVDIKAGWKVGIVGRTGAGKSSLIGALFRLATIEGEILIDDIDTKTISLDSLRTHISIIPQNPVLFSNTIRNNLDPFNLYSDDALWRALEDVELKASISSLDFMVTEAGTNFSVGQRQLICLARAILRNNKVLVLDEATANVDPQTDALIQHTIRVKFKYFTVLTIAHRLHTVMDSDRILVMDAGYAKEFDIPHILLQDPNGILRNMVDVTGPQESEILKTAASKTYFKLMENES